jgi:hypothetical protein
MPGNRRIAPGSPTRVANNTAAACFFAIVQQVVSIRFASTALSPAGHDQRDRPRRVLLCTRGYNWICGGRDVVAVAAKVAQQLVES